MLTSEQMDFLKLQHTKYGKVGASEYMQEVVELLMCGELTIAELEGIAEEQYQLYASSDRYVPRCYWASMKHGARMLKMFMPV